jgi:hypothetical protein
VPSPIKKEARARRVYEYIDADGVVFFSFAKLHGYQIRRMTLTDVRGTHFRNHLTQIQHLAQMDEGEDSAGG